MTMLIAGILRLDGAAPDRSIVERMLDILQPAGMAAAREIATSGPFCAGALSLTPNENPAPAPPQIFHDGNRLLVADARLYGHPDDPLDPLLRSIRKNGNGAGSDLHGDFAFADWNGERLLLGRDHHGVRPLQYTIRESEYLAFASLPTALLQTGLAPRTLDASVMATYPITVCAIGERTYFSRIKAVQAAHTLTVAPGQAPGTHRYWRLPLGKLLPANSDPQELSQEIHRLLEQAVRRRLPDHGSGAGHLSGGLDSTAISILAARSLAEGNREFEAFCYREDYTDPEVEIIDEWNYAASIAQREANIRLHGVGTPDQVSLMETLDPDLFLPMHPDDPEEQVLARAAAAGAPVVLSGWGGDEVVTWRGHGNVAELFWTGQWQAMTDALQHRSQKGGSSPLAIFRKAVLSESLPRPLRDLVRSRHGDETAGWIDTIAGLIPEENRTALLDIADREYGADSRIQRRGALEHWSIPEKLEAYAQRGVRHGIAYAFPMLDLDLLAFAIRIPAVLLHDGETDRAIFRRAMVDVLPDMVRTKQEKLIPFPAETLRHAAANPDILAEIERMSANPLVRQFVDTDGLIEYISRMSSADDIRQWMNDSASRGEQINARELYHIMTLTLAWYLDRHGTEVE